MHSMLKEWLNFHVNVTLHTCQTSIALGMGGVIQLRYNIMQPIHISDHRQSTLLRMPNGTQLKHMYFAHTMNECP